MHVFEQEEWGDGGRGQVEGEVGGRGSRLEGDGAK